MFSLYISGNKNRHFRKMNVKIKIFLLLFLCLITLSACTETPPQPTSTATPQPTSTATPQPTASSTPEPKPTNTPPPLTATVAALRDREGGGIRFMTYNILGGTGRTGLDAIISILKTYNPDVLGIQEANRWYQDNYAMAQRVANELGMNYVYCKGESEYVDPNGDTFDTIIMTRFDILDSENYPEVEHCTGRAEIRLPDGQTVQVFNLHTPHGSCARNFPKVIDITKPYMDGLAVMLGDFNVVNPASYDPDRSHVAMRGCPEMLVESGWTWLSGSIIESSIDQIWVSPPMKDYEYIAMIRPPLYLAHWKDLDLASDHSPVAADIFFP